MKYLQVSACVDYICVFLALFLSPIWLQMTMCTLKAAAVKIKKQILDKPNITTTKEPTEAQQPPFTYLLNLFALYLPVAYNDKKEEKWEEKKE